MASWNAICKNRLKMQITKSQLPFEYQLPIATYCYSIKWEFPFECKYQLPFIVHWNDNWHWILMPNASFAKMSLFNQMPIAIWVPIATSYCSMKCQWIYLNANCQLPHTTVQWYDNCHLKANCQLSYTTVQWKAMVHNRGLTKCQPPYPKRPSSIPIAECQI